MSIEWEGVLNASAESYKGYFIGSGGWHWAAARTLVLFISSKTGGFKMKRGVNCTTQKCTNPETCSFLYFELINWMIAF